ncbi:hypothetical protein K3495_g11822 [Podosphaera aphanis]|nr:hypothetical protein K3495_g11822 [Podosphaera aphanis]
MLRAYAICPDTLSRKREDQPEKLDDRDKGVEYREHTLLPASRFDSKEMNDLLRFRWSDLEDVSNQESMKAYKRKQEEQSCTEDDC